MVSREFSGPNGYLTEPPPGPRKKRKFMAPPQDKFMNSLSTTLPIGLDQGIILTTWVQNRKLINHNFQILFWVCRVSKKIDGKLNIKQGKNDDLFFYWLNLERKSNKLDRVYIY